MSLSAMTGLSASPTKNPSKNAKGRRPKKPGGDHLGKATHAHGSGDFHGARTHALNYAKSITQHLAGNVGASPIGDDMESMGEPPVVNTAPPAPASPAGVSSLAALMRSRKK